MPKQPPPPYLGKAPVSTSNQPPLDGHMERVESINFKYVLLCSDALQLFCTSKSKAISDSVTHKQCAPKSWKQIDKALKQRKEELKDNLDIAEKKLKDEEEREISEEVERYYEEQSPGDVLDVKY